MRAANTGISAVIDPRGRTEARTPIFTEEILKGTFAMRDTKTFYVRYGDYFVLLALVILVILAIVGKRSGSANRKA